MMKKINNWKYEVSYSDKKIPILKITPEQKTPSPVTLSKYYSLNKNNVHAFINKQFYVSQPDNLNDLFDFHLNLIDFSKHKFSDLEILYQNEAEKKEAFEAFQNNKTEYLEKIRNTIYALWISLFGILCMTEENDNELMWAHYTNNTGFLLEFNPAKFGENFVGPYPINYVPQLEAIDFSTLDKNLGFFIVSSMKKIEWKYENEFRYFCLPDIKNNFKVAGHFSNNQFNFDLQDRLISYHGTALNKIILAFNFFSSDIVDSVGEHEYFLNFKDENALLKICVFDRIIQDKLTVELCVQDQQNFKLTTIPIQVRHIEGSVYIVKEIR